MLRSVRMWTAILLTCSYWVLAASLPAQPSGRNSIRNLLNSTNAFKRNPLFCDECGLSDVSVGKIVGGRPASLGEYPWMAYLEIGCGGTLIKNQWILTAAHCYYKVKKPKQYSITLGKTDIDDEPSGSLTVKPIKVIVHKKFSLDTFENDIALLKLPSPVTFSDTIKPLCVAETMPSGTETVATGWGVKKFGSNKVQSGLREVVLDLTTNKKCKSLASANPKFFICALTKNKDTCQGDSGGPLMMEVTSGQWTQVGIVSHGEGCAMKNSPGVYTRVTKYIKWIISKTGSNSC